MSYSGEAETLPLRSSSDIDEFLLKSSVDVVITGNAPEWNSTFDNGTSVLPVAPQAAAIVYNVPGFPDLSTGLKLDSPTLFGILNGNVSFWNDSRITELNSDITLPHERIEVIHSPSEQSTSQILDEYLSAANETATWWNTTVPLDDPSDVAAAVRRTPYSIAYVDYSYATQSRMTYAAIQNYDGDFVVPSSDSIGMAVMNGTVFGDLEQLDNNTLQNSSSFPPPQIAAGKLGNGSYPMTGFYYAIFQSEDLQDLRMNSTVLNQTASKANFVTEEFTRWIASDGGQSILKEVGYPSIYEFADELALYRDRLFD
jgi:ABC-type phosphate transport system substrate-binding protein